MLDETLCHSDRNDIGNVENNKPVSMVSKNEGNLNKTRHVLLKKGGKRLRSTSTTTAAVVSLRPPQGSHHHIQKHQGTNPARVADHNNNHVTTSSSGIRSAVQPKHGHPHGASTVLTLHPLKPGPKKEVTMFFFYLIMYTLCKRRYPVFFVVLRPRRRCIPEWT